MTFTFAIAQILQPNVKAVALSVGLENFELRCWARGHLEKHGMMPLQEAVDGLQNTAVSTGLVDLIGQDVVQAIMAAAFEHRRGRTC
jgi:hypothetical protein